MIVDKALKASLRYDRAYSRLQQIIVDLMVRQKADEKTDLENGDLPDESYDLLITDLKQLQRSYRLESNRLWAYVEQNKDIHAKAYEDLANAVVIRAVQDYEMAISGHGNEQAKMMIDNFSELADDGFIPYTNLKVRAILDKVIRKHKKFVEIANENAREIIAETKAHRAAKVELTKNTYKCPLCGGALYESSLLGVHRVCCTGCYLSEIVKVDKKKL